MLVNSTISMPCRHSIFYTLDMKSNADSKKKQWTNFDATYTKNNFQIYLGERIASKGVPATQNVSTAKIKLTATSNPTSFWIRLGC